tara:strand:- start:2852 stop:5098 length:2247 start_codon:yes stop_codon:yes gene_type:complete
MAQRANNAYYRDPDVARGFNNLSSAILGSASGDAAYELARKRRAEAIAANLKNEDINQLRGNRNVVRGMVSGMFGPEQMDTWTDDEWAALGGLFAQDENLMKNMKTGYLAPKQGSVYDAQAFKEQEAGLLSRAKRTPLENQEAAIQAAIQSKELQSLAAEIVGIMPDVHSGPGGMFPDKAKVYPKDIDQITRAVLMSGTKSGAGIGGRISAYRHQQEIERIEREKAEMQLEVESIKKTIQEENLTQEQIDTGIKKIEQLVAGIKLRTQEQNQIKATAEASMADSNLAVTLAEEQNKIDISNNKKDISDLNLKDAKAKSSFETENIKHEKDINELERKRAELQLKISEFKVDEAQSQADTAFSVFMEQSEDRATKGKIGEQKVKKVTYEAETADIKKDIAEIQKDYQEELKPLKLQYQEKQNQKVSEEITTEQTLRYFNATKIKASTRAILDRLAASLDISAQDLLKATSQAEKASTEAQSAKDLAPGLKKIQKSKIQQEQDKAKLFAQELKQALRMDPVKFEKLLKQVDLIKEQITGQKVKTQLSELMLGQKQEIGDLELALKEMEIEIAKKKSKNASLKNIETQQDILIKQAPKNQKAASNKKPSWGSTQDQLATEIYDGALAATYRMDSENPNMIWQNQVPEAVRIKLKQNAIMDASEIHGDPGHRFFNNIRGAMNDAVNVIAGGVIIAKNDSVEVGIPNRLFTGVKIKVLNGKIQEAKSDLMDMSYTGVQADAIIERAQKSTSSR